MNENVESSFVKIKAFTMLYTLVSSHNIEYSKKEKKENHGNHEIYLILINIIKLELNVIKNLIKILMQVNLEFPIHTSNNFPEINVSIHLICFETRSSRIKMIENFKPR